MTTEKVPVLYDQYGKEIIKDMQINLDSSFSAMRGGFSNTSTKDMESMPYKHHVWTFTCAWTIVKNVSRLPLVLIDENNPTEYIRKHDVLTRLRRPNSLMTKTSFIQAILLSILLPSNASKKKGGQCFLVCLSGDAVHDTVNLTNGEIPIAIHPYNDTFIKPMKLKRNGREIITGWEFEIPGYPDSKTPYGMNEIIRINQFNPYNWLEGVANSQPAQVALLQDIKSDVHNVNMFNKGNVPIGILASDSILGRKKKEEQLRHWNETMGNPNNESGIAITEKGLKYQNIGLSNQDMQYQYMKEFLQEQFTASFGLNKIAMGKYEEINKATIIEGRKMLWQDTYLPFAELLEEAINAQWIDYIDGLKLKFDTSGIPSLRPDYTGRAKNASIMVDKMFFPPVLAAELNQIPLSEDVLKEYPWLKENPALLKKLAKPDEEKEKEKENKSVIISKETGNEEKEAFWKNYILKVLDPSEKDMNSKMVRFFNRQRNLMQDKVDAWVKVQKAIKAKPSDFLFDKNTETDRLVKMFEPIVKQHMKVVEVNLEEELGELIEFQVTNEMSLEYVKDRKKELRKINNTTFNRAKDEVNEAINKAVKENMTVNEAAKEVKSAINKVYEGDTAKGTKGRKANSKTIARTEIGSITSKTRFNAFQVEGIDFHEWFSALDEGVRTNHMKVHGYVRKIGKKFPFVDMLYPLDPNGKVGEIVNCRCVALAHAGPEFDMPQ